MFKFKETHNGFSVDSNENPAANSEKTVFFQSVVKYFDKKEKVEKRIYSGELYRSPAQAQMHGFEMVEQSNLEQDKMVKNIQIGVLGLTLAEMAYDD